MRVMFCMDGPDAVNGPNVWLTRHLPLLRRLGIAPELLYLSWFPGRPCRFRAALEASGIPCRAVQLEGFLEVDVESIVQVVAGDPPDVFVPNYSVPGYFASRFLREAGAVTVGTLHSDDPYYHDIIDLFLRGDAVWRLSAVAGVSDFLRQTVEGAAPYLDAPYGAPIPEFTARPSVDRFVVAYCGRMVEHQKRVMRVASAMMAAANASGRIHCVMWGGGPDEDRVAALIAANGMEDRVRLAGMVPPDRMQRELASAHMLVLLSDFEGLSIALMEAMACGVVPVVARMRSGVSDLIVHGQNGLVVEGDDTDGFVREVAALADDPHRWQQLSNAARETIISRGYTDSACAEKWAAFLFERVGESGPQRAVVLPPPEDWGLPPRSVRPNGIRAVDRRSTLPDARRAVRAGRPVFLWGASKAGEAMHASMARAGLPVSGFIDSNPVAHGTTHCGLPIFSPDHLISFSEDGVRPYVVISSQFRGEIADALEHLGLHEGPDYPMD